MSFSHSDVHDWAQQALDKYNGGYSASDINLNATVYLYGLRDDGNSDAALAAASHYLHCRYVASMTYVVGAIIGTGLVLGDDGIWKLIEKYSSSDLSYHFGKSPPSSFSPTMIAWDMHRPRPGEIRGVRGVRYLSRAAGRPAVGFCDWLDKTSGKIVSRPEPFWREVVDDVGPSLLGLVQCEVWLGFQVQIR